MPIKIAIVGAGNLGQAEAAHLALLGHEVRIWNRTASKIHEINERGCIRAHGVIEGDAKMHCASPDLADVIPGADAIMVTVPASSHRPVIEAMAPYLEDGQSIALHPGHTFGAIDCFSALEKLGYKLDLTFCEIQTSLITCRLTGPAEVLCAGIKQALPIAVFPSDHGFDRVEYLFDAYPSSIRAADTLKTSLENLNAPVHPSVVMTNLARMERGDHFLFYWDGVTPAVAKVIEAVDMERYRIAELLDADPITLSEFYDRSYDVEGDELWQKMHSNMPYEEIFAPKRLDTRLILEDLPTGLVAFSSMGKAVGVPTPACDALIALCNVVFERDFWEGARTLENMGLDHLDAEGLKRFVKTGQR